MVTWRQLITGVMGFDGDSWANLVAITLTDEELDRPFDNGFGGSEGEPFCAWTSRRVYFPVVYDGSEWVSSVSRMPDGQPVRHVGSE